MYAYRIGRGNRRAGDRTKTIMIAGGNQSAGFTIVETMIVLAVSAGLLMVGMFFVNGRQNKTDFMVAINGQKQQLQQIINETANGFYPHQLNFTCAGSTSGGAALLTAGGSTGQGANSSCVFLGKAVTYGTPDDTSSIIFPIMGNQQYNSGGNMQDVESFQQARPIALGHGKNISNPLIDLPDLSTTNQLSNGLTFVHVTYTYYNPTTHGSSTVPLVPNSAVAAFAFAYDLGQYSLSASGGLNSAAQRLDLFAFDNAENWTAQATNDALTNQLNAASLVDNTATKLLDRVDLCFASGGTNQSGKISISGQGKLDVNLTIYPDKTCS